MSALINSVEGTMERKRKRRPSRETQLGLRFHPRGGRRTGAGRPKGKHSGVPHRARLAFKRLPVHVTLRMAEWVYNLRSKRSFRVIEGALLEGSRRFGARVIRFSVQGNHIHLLMEAESARALSRCLKGLSVRIAKGLNRMMGRVGKVLKDRYHAHLLRTPSEVRHATDYIKNNYRRHMEKRGERFHATLVDPFSSESPELT